MYACPEDQVVVTDGRGNHFCTTEKLLQLWDQHARPAANVDPLIYILRLPNGRSEKMQRATNVLPISDQGVLEELYTWQTHELLETRLVNVLHQLSSQAGKDLLLAGERGPDPQHAHDPNEIRAEYETFLQNWQSSFKSHVKRELQVTFKNEKWKTVFQSHELVSELSNVRTLLATLNRPSLRASLEITLEQLESSFTRELKKNLQWKQSHFCNRYCDARETLAECYRRNVKAAGAKFSEVYAAFGTVREECGEDGQLFARLREQSAPGADYPVLGYARQFAKLAKQTRIGRVFRKIVDFARRALVSVLTWMKNFARTLFSFVLTYSSSLLSLQSLVRAAVPKEYCRKATRVANVLRNPTVDSIFAKGDFVNTISHLGAAGLLASGEHLGFFTAAYQQTQRGGKAMFARNFRTALDEHEGSAQLFVASILQLVATHSPEFERVAEKLCASVVSALSAIVALGGVFTAGASAVVVAGAAQPAAALAHSLCVRTVSVAAAVALGVALYSAYQYVENRLQELPERTLRAAYAPSATQKLADFVQLLNFDRWCPPQINYLYPGTSLEFFSTVNGSDVLHFTATLAQEWSRAFHLYQILTVDENVKKGFAGVKELLAKHSDWLTTLVKQSSMACTPKVTALLSGVGKSALLAASSPILVALGAVALGYGVLSLQTRADEGKLASVRELYAAMLVKGEGECAERARVNGGVLDTLGKTVTWSANDIVKTFRPCLKNVSAESLELLHRFAKPGARVLLLRDLTPERGENETELDALLDQSFEHACFAVQRHWRVSRVESAGTAHTSARVTLARGGETLEHVSARTLLCVERDEVFAVGALVAFFHSDEIGVVVGHADNQEGEQRVWVVTPRSGDPAQFSLSYVSVEDLYVPSRVPLAPQDVVVGANANLVFAVGEWSNSGIVVRNLPTAPSRCVLAFPARLQEPLVQYNHFLNASGPLVPLDLNTLLSSNSIRLLYQEQRTPTLAAVRSQLRAVYKDDVLDVRKAYVEQHCFLPAQEAWSDVMHLYTRRNVERCGDVEYTTRQLTEESPPSRKYGPERVRVQRAQEMAHWLNNPFPSVPAPYLFAAKQLLTSDEHFKVRLRRRAFARVGAANIYLYRFDTHRCGARDDTRPFFGVNGASCPAHSTCVVHGRIAVDYNALPAALRAKMAELRARVVVGVFPWHKWRRVRGTENCYARAGSGVALYYHARTRRFALRFPAEARNANERWWRAEYAHQPFGEGFVCT